ARTPTTHRLRPPVTIRRGRSSSPRPARRSPPPRPGPCQPAAPPPTRPRSPAGQRPQGSVTFTLFAPSDTACATPVATKTVALSGTTASSGPVTVGAAGTYRWVASLLRRRHRQQPR